MLLTTLLVLSVLFPAQNIAFPEREVTERTSTSLLSQFEKNKKETKESGLEIEYDYGENTIRLSEFVEWDKLSDSTVIKSEKPEFSTLQHYTILCSKNGRIQQLGMIVQKEPEEQKFIRTTPSQVIRKAISAAYKLRLNSAESYRVFEEVIKWYESYRDFYCYYEDFSVHYTPEYAERGLFSEDALRRMHIGLPLIKLQTNTISIAKALKDYLYKQGVPSDKALRFSIYDTTRECEISNPETIIPTSEKLSCFRIQMQEPEGSDYLLFAKYGYWKILPVGENLAEVMRHGAQICAPFGCESLSFLHLYNKESVYLFKQILETYKIKQPAS